MEPLNRCVWMTAKVLTYRLCDSDYDCEHCLVDLALREGTQPPREAHEDAAPEPQQGGGGAEPSDGHELRLPKGGFCHPSHLHVHVLAGGCVRIELDEMGSRLLGQVDNVRMPPPGAALHRGRKAWTFTGEAGTVDFQSPMDGELVSRNEQLIAEPDLMRRDPLRHLPLGRIRASRLREDLGRLLYGRRARAWWRTDLARLRERLLAARAVDSGTVPDGGDLNANALDRIEARLRRELVQEFILRNESQNEGGRSSW